MIKIAHKDAERMHDSRTSQFEALTAIFLPLSTTFCTAVAGRRLLICLLGALSTGKKYKRYDQESDNQGHSNHD
jgi:hypothetical protein